MYEEARRCTTVEAYTASVLVLRKLLMHIAVEKEAEENKNFYHYVEYLASKGYVPPDGKNWIHKIRQLGNEIALICYHLLKCCLNLFMNFLQE